jgi:DNA helicase-2/ATP-dependent DNA helicase PcrA
MRGDIDYTSILIRGLEMAKDGQWGGCSHIIVDECQDNDALQWALIRTLASQASVYTVGDKNQCIYQWRGSQPEQIDALPWPRLPLTKTFRCRKNVVELANRIKFIDGELTTDKPDGTIVENGDALTLTKQALLKFDPEDIAILCRYNEEADAFSDKLSQNSIPASRNKKVEKGPIYWLLRYLAAPGSQTARDKASEAISPFLALTDDRLFKLVGSSKPDIRPLVEQWLSAIGVAYGPAEVLGAMKLPAYLNGEAELYAREYAGETLESFRRDEADLQTPSISGITVNTIHGAKGLEWPCVFVLMRGERVNAEECRLFYVGVTRSMDTLILPGDGGWKNYLREA